jgi:hypothetical protein
MQRQQQRPKCQHIQKPEFAAESQQIENEHSEIGQDKKRRVREKKSPQSPRNFFAEHKIIVTLKAAYF